MMENLAYAAVIVTCILVSTLVILNILTLLREMQDRHRNKDSGSTSTPDN